MAGRTVDGITGKHAQFVPEIVFPDHPRLAGFRPGWLAVHIQAHHLETVRHEIDALPVHDGSRTDPQCFRVGTDADEESVYVGGKRSGRALPLPEEPSGLLVQAHQQTQIRLPSTNEDPSPGHRRRGVNGLAELGGPFHVLRRLHPDPASLRILLPWHKRVRQTFLFGNHVPAVGAAPLGPILAQGIGREKPQAKPCHGAPTRLSQGFEETASSHAFTQRASRVAMKIHMPIVSWRQGSAFRHRNQPIKSRQNKKPGLGETIHHSLQAHGSDPCFEGTPWSGARGGI